MESKNVKGVKGHPGSGAQKSSDGIIVDPYIARRRELVRRTRSLDRHPSRTQTIDVAKKPVAQNKKSHSTATKKPSKAPKISLPKLPRQLSGVFARVPKLPKKTLIAVACVSVLLVGGGVFAAVHTSTKKSAAKNTTAKSEVVENLEYQTVMPAGKSIAQLGGWKRVSPAKSDPVYAYTDAINGIPVSVSQQPLPKAFIGSADDKVSQLAKAYNATSIIDADGTKVYIGISSKGPQSTIFTRNNLLILIKSQKKIEDKDWVQYINSLS